VDLEAAHRTYTHVFSTENVQSHAGINRSQWSLRLHHGAFTFESRISRTIAILERDLFKPTRTTAVRVHTVHTLIH